MLNIDLISLGKRIRDLRGAEKQKDISEKFGLLPKDLGRLEKGKIMHPTSETIYNISTYFNVSMSWLLTGIGQKSLDKEITGIHNSGIANKNDEDFMSMSQKDQLIAYKDQEIADLKAKLAKYEESPSEEQSKEVG